MQNLTIRLETQKDYRAVEELIPDALAGKNRMYIPSTAADCC